MFEWLRLRKVIWQRVSVISPVDYNGEEDIFYHLFESEFNERKVEISTDKCTIIHNRQFIKRAKEHSVYKGTVTRWLNGISNPEIPLFKKNTSG